MAKVSSIAYCETPRCCVRQREGPTSENSNPATKENPMRNNFRLPAMLLFGSALALSALACNGTNPSNNLSSNSPINIAGNWTITATSTQGHGTVSTTAEVVQSGQGMGTDGLTTLSGDVGSITISQSGTNLTGTITNSIKSVSYDFTGNLSGGNITITGSVGCGTGMGVQSTSITGTITSTAMHGNYTITRNPGCYHPSDAGTWTATKQ